MEELAIKIENVSKEYRLGAIGGGTLKGDLQSLWARVRKKEDPNSKIGSDTDIKIGERFLALDDISFEVKKGEAVGIIGHNGAGKSTLLKLLCRVTAPTKGAIGYNGRIASMLEVGTGFHPEMTGRENIYLNGAILGMTKAEIDSKIEEIIDFSEVRKFIDTPVKRYSSGMYVKLAFSVAAHLDSEIMIMDEVLAVGDLAFQKKCLSKMRDAAKLEGRTVLYVSHNMNTIKSLCDRCIVLNKGKIVFEGDVEEGIKVYMGKNDELSTELDVSHLERISKGYGNIVHINSFKLLNNDTACYYTNERMIFQVQWTNKEILDDLRIRIECYNSDGTVVGMTESPNFAHETVLGDNHKQFCFLLNNLVAGSYYFRLSFFTLFENGVHNGLDDIRNIKFIITENEHDKTNWERKYWGSIRFNDIIVN